MRANHLHLWPGNMSNVTVITRRQLEAIRAKIQETEHTPQQQDRLHLKKLSDQRAARWPDTLQAQRQRKAKVKEERLAAEEAERVRLDEIEAEERAERRRIQIEAANKMLYEDADKPKAFRSKLLLSDVMQEQAAQREYAAQIKALRRQQDEDFLKQLWAGLKAQEEKELAALRAAKQRALAQRDVQLQQLEALKQRILAEQAADRAEGALIRQRALEEAEQLKQKEKEQRERAKRANLETRQANEVLQKFKQLEVEREKEAMAAIEAYAAKKAELAEERRRREAEREAAKEARKQRMRDYMEKNLLESKAASDSRLARDIKQAEDKAEADAAEEQRLRQEEMDSIDRSRKRQVEVEKARAEAQEAADKEFAAAWQKRLEQLKAEEVQEAKNRLDINKRYVAFLQHQIDQKAARAAVLVAQDHEASQVRDWMLQDEEETFEKYANVCIDEWARQGKTTKPMELHMQKLKRHAKSVTR